jgi:hypothetical protein
MLNALVFHGDHLKPGEQFDKDRGDEKERARPDLKLRVVPGGRAGQDGPEHAGLAAGRAGEGRAPVGQRDGNLACRPALIMDLAVSARRKEALASVAGELRGLGVRAAAVPADLADLIARRGVIHDRQDERCP